MDPVSNVDRLIIILRQKLQERARLAARRRPANEKSADRTEAPALRAIASVEGIDEHVLRRSLVQTILADQFGPTLINDAQFQQVVSRVTSAIEEDAQASELISRVIAEFRAA